MIDMRLSILDQHIANLQREKAHFIQKRISIVQEVQKEILQSSPVGRLPICYIGEFLNARDMSRLGSTSWHYRNGCIQYGKQVLANISSPARAITAADCEALVNRICLPAIRSLNLDAKCLGTSDLLAALASRGSELSQLSRLAIHAAADSGEFVANVCVLVKSLRANQLTHIHLSGLRSLSTVGSILAAQSESVVDLRVDYFVAGHESELLPSMLPRLPRVESLVYDVADVTDVPATLLADRLGAILRPGAVQRIYLPHMQISGESLHNTDLVALVRQRFAAASQLVLRFHHLPFSVREIVEIRHDLRALPAVCISDHFIVAMTAWAEWWPAMHEVWKHASRITGLSVFREQIDFEALGSDATREWLKLSRAQKREWNEDIAPRVAQLYSKRVREDSLSSQDSSGSSQDEMPVPPPPSPQSAPPTILVSSSNGSSTRRQTSARGA